LAGRFFLPDCGKWVPVFVTLFLLSLFGFGLLRRRERATNESSNGNLQKAFARPFLLLPGEKPLKPGMSLAELAS